MSKFVFFLIKRLTKFLFTKHTFEWFLSQNNLQLVGEIIDDILEEGEIIIDDAEEQVGDIIDDNLKE